MKNIIFGALVATTLAFGYEATAQITTPQPSPTSTVQQAVGITNFTVTYSRPGAKGRTVFGGEIVPFDKEWRTGANSATMINFDDKVKMEGNEIPAGKYSLFTIPSKNEWTVIINKDISGSSVRDASKDLVSFKVKPQALPMHVETFTISFNEFTNTGAFLDLSWEKTLVRIKIETDVDTKVMEQIQKFAKSPMSAVGRNYFAAATYYLENGKDMKQALEWVNKAAEINPQAYWILHTKALIQGKLGDYKAAIETAEASKKIATEQKDDAYITRNDKVITEWKKMK